MGTSWILLLSLLPVAAILYYVYHKDHDPEPPRTIGFAFLWGCLSVIPAITAELLFPSSNQFVELFVNIGLVEESVKFAVLMLYIWKHADFNDSFDAIVYSVTISLGFAAVENIMYNINGGFAVSIIRALFSIPGHTCFAILMGVFLAKAKTHFYYGRRQEQYTSLMLALLTATIAHGTYDYLAIMTSSNEDFVIWLLAFVIILDIACLIIVHNASKNDKPMVQQ